MPREVKQMPVARALDEKMREFKDSLPLFVDLKHEALRDRWECFFISLTAQVTNEHCPGKPTLGHLQPV